MSNGRVYLGIGLKFPLTILQGKALVSNDVALLNQSIKIILDTKIGTRIFLPEFGSRLSELLFEPNDEVLFDLLSLFITEALNKWEKRVKVLAVNFKIDGVRTDCTIQFRVLNSNEVESYIYPFYRNAI